MRKPKVNDIVLPGGFPTLKIGYRYGRLYICLGSTTKEVLLDDDFWVPLEDCAIPKGVYHKDGKIYYKNRFWKIVHGLNFWQYNFRFDLRLTIARIKFLGIKELYLIPVWVRIKYPIWLYISKKQKKLWPFDTIGLAEPKKIYRYYKWVGLENLILCDNLVHYAKPKRPELGFWLTAKYWDEPEEWYEEEDE